MRNPFRKKLTQPKSYYPAEKVNLNSMIVPEDWLVLELGQSPVHCLWHCAIYNMVTKQSSSVEEYDTPNEALEAALKQIKD